jgi:uncharacterized membrane protein (UPF0127 family)
LSNVVRSPRLVDRLTGRVIVERLELATTFWQRFCGWQFRKIPVVGTGILLAPCSSIHTFWMRFPIDIAFLDAEGVIVEIAADVSPWRIVPKVRSAVAVLEIPSGRCPLFRGACVELHSIVSDDLPAHLQKWVC